MNQVHLFNYASNYRSCKNVTRNFDFNKCHKVYNTLKMCSRFSWSKPKSSVSYLLFPVMDAYITEAYFSDFGC